MLSDWPTPAELFEEFETHLDAALTGIPCPTTGTGLPVDVVVALDQVVTFAEQGDEFTTGATEYARGEFRKFLAEYSKP